MPFRAHIGKTSRDPCLACRSGPSRLFWSDLEGNLLDYFMPQDRKKLKLSVSEFLVITNNRTTF